MNLKVLAVLIRKDVTLFFKNRFFALISGLALFFYVAVYFLLPQTVDETLELAWYGPELPILFNSDVRDEGLRLHTYESEAALREAVEAGDEQVGVALPADFVQQLATGEKPQAVIYFKSDLPDEYRSAYELLLEELGYMFAGIPLHLEVEEVLLGPDMAGQQAPPRQRMLPLFAVFILMVETWGLAALISSEVENGTLRALLVTPLTVPGLFLSKGTTGVLMAFVQVLFLLGITGGLRNEPLLVVAALLLGSLLVTGIGFLIASVARDMMSVLAWGMLAVIVLAIPSFNILLPGLTTGWVKAIPSYYLVDTIYRTINFGAGWRELSAGLLALLAFAAAFFGLGVFAFERRLR